MTFNLDNHFRRDSAARVIAERIMTGKPLTRQELVDGLGVSVTSVNRVVEDLTAAGCKITREVADDGRQARFRLVSVGRSLAATRLPSVSDEVRIVGAEIIGDHTMVSFEQGKTRYRGPLRGISRVVPLGKRAIVKGVMAVGDDRADVQLEVPGESKPIRIDAVRNET